MSLNNSQFDSILRMYSRREAAHRHLLDERTREIRQKLPRVKEIDEEIAHISVQSARKLLLGDKNAPAQLKERIAALSREREAVLLQGGYPRDYLAMTYDCPDCRDSGFVGGQKCHCFRRAEIDLLYTQSNLKEILEKENFATFSYEYYSNDILEEKSGVSSLARITKAVEVCHHFVDNFDSEFTNLFFYGDTGVGKTFLTHCIARELLDTTHSVVYFSAQELFAILAQKRFARTEEAAGVEAVYQCDLLIIDDLGTELTNAFVTSELFLCINERLANRKATIISTNLPLKVFADTYSERIFSRISSNFTLLKLFGKDIRLLKKMERRLPNKPVNETKPMIN